MSLFIILEAARNLAPRSSFPITCDGVQRLAVTDIYTDRKCTSLDLHGHRTPKTKSRYVCFTVWLRISSDLYGYRAQKMKYWQSGQALNSKNLRASRHQGVHPHVYSVVSCTVSHSCIHFVLECVSCSRTLQTFDI